MLTVSRKKKREIILSHNSIAAIVSLYAGDNPAHFVASIDSLLSQTYPVDIFLKIDGKIPLNLKEMVEEYQDKGAFAYVDFRPQNKGLAVSLNELLDEVMVRGYHYIVRMDADDISLADRVEKQYQFMQKHPDIDVVGSYIEEFGDGFNYDKVVRYPLTHEQMYWFFRKRVPIAHVTAFYRKRFFERAGLYPTSSHTNEDTLMWLKGFKNGCKFANIPEVLVNVRVSKSFFSRRGGLNKTWSDFKDRIKVIRELGYNYKAYGYALALLIVNLLPGRIKKIAYKRFR